MDRHIQVMALLFFAGIALIIGIGSRTLATWTTISRIYVAFAVLTHFIPRKKLPVIYRVRKEMKTIFTIFALSPLLTGLVLLANYSIITEHHRECYKIERTIHYSNDYIFKIELEEAVFDQFKSVRNFSSDKFKFTPDSACYDIGRGIVGMKVVKSSWLVPKQK